MKIEIGESLISSWLKHECGCQIVQQNWKTSSLWEPIISPSEIKKTYSALERKTKESDLDFLTKKKSNTKVGQLIKQGEVDCLGMVLKQNENNSMIVDKIYAVDIAFHENGLNYNGLKETIKRIRKKYIRTAFTLYQFFGLKSAEIIFASPKTSYSHFSSLKQIALDMNNMFNDLGFDFNFKIYCNEDFESLILLPTLNLIDKNADSSELFLRSIKMTNLFENSKMVRGKDIVTVVKSDITNTNFEETTKLAIGVTVKNIFTELSDKNALSKEELCWLCEDDYSKKKFDLYFPVLKAYRNDDDAFIDDKRRYYAKTYKFQNVDYLLCNHWFETNREQLKVWYKSINKDENLNK